MSVQDLGISVDTVWMLLAAMLVFFSCSRDLPSARRALPVVKIQRTSCLRTLSIL